MCSHVDIYYLTYLYVIEPVAIISTNTPLFTVPTPYIFMAGCINIICDNINTA